MKALFSAIVDLFSGSDLESSLSGKLYLYEAPESAALPYAVFMMESDQSDYTFDSTSHEIGLSFFVTAANGQAAVVSDLLEELENLYDDCRLTVSGYRFLRMERKDVQLLHSPGGEWQYMVRYRILLEEE